MRYDILVDLANCGQSTLLRANSYLAEDLKRTEDDAEYRHKLYAYHDVLRKCGFKVIKKYVKHYVDDEGVVTTKANADMDLAIDAILQARNLDRIILLTGDGDFIRLITALQNMGCRVEVIGFNNVSNELREAADYYISGFLVPGLLPFAGDMDSETSQRGVVATYKQDRGFGFFRYFIFTDEGLKAQTVFFHCSKSIHESESHIFAQPGKIFEFEIVPTSRDAGKVEAQNIRLLKDDDY